jgi:hypothetical protein
MAFDLKSWKTIGAAASRRELSNLRLERVGFLEVTVAPDQRGLPFPSATLHLIAAAARIWRDNPSSCFPRMDGHRSWDGRDSLDRTADVRGKQEKVHRRTVGVADEQKMARETWGCRRRHWTT